MGAVVSGDDDADEARIIVRIDPGASAGRRPEFFGFLDVGHDGAIRRNREKMEKNYSSQINGNSNSHTEPLGTQRTTKTINDRYHTETRRAQRTTKQTENIWKRTAKRSNSYAFVVVPVFCR
jgi:hypothetical protein